MTDGQNIVERFVFTAKAGDWAMPTAQGDECHMLKCSPAELAKAIDEAVNAVSCQHRCDPCFEARSEPEQWDCGANSFSPEAIAKNPQLKDVPLIRVERTSAAEEQNALR